jgi:RNA polymerase sigma-70 factor, ECF subfamily
MRSGEEKAAKPKTCGSTVESLDRVIRLAYPQRGRPIGSRTATLSRNAGRTAEPDRTMAAVSPLGRASRVEPREAPGDALTGLYERHADRVFSYCLNWLRSREEAEDAAQTTFLYAYRALDRGVVPTHERPWLLSIARNVCLSRTDAARRRAVEVAQDPHALEEIIAAPAASNELDGLADALATLTEQQRHAILLREWHGFTYGEIAERLELSQAAVETLLFRARRSLARRLRQPLGVGSFLPWLRSLGEGGAAKVALGAAAVAVTASTGAVTLARPQHQHQHQPRPRHAARAAAAQSAPAPRARSHTGSVRVPPVKHRRAAAKASSAPVSAPRNEAPVQQPAPTPPQRRAAAPVPAEPVTAAQPIADTATTAVTEAAVPVVDTVTNTASSVVTNTADTVANTASAVVATAQAAIDAVTSVVPAITGPKLP